MMTSPKTLSREDASLNYSASAAQFASDRKENSKENSP
jgi:hypothetical protein